MSIIRQTSRRIGRGTCIALAAVIGTFGIAAPSQAEAATFEPIMLKVHDNEDWWTNWDQTGMYYDGVKVFDRTVHKGQIVEAQNLPVAYISRLGRLRIDLSEFDVDSAYDLGTQYVGPTLTRQSSVHFGGGWWDGFHYELVYRVR